MIIARKTAYLIATGTLIAAAALYLGRGADTSPSAVTPTPTGQQRGEKSVRHQALVQSPRGDASQATEGLTDMQRRAQQREQAFTAAFTGWYQPPAECEDIQSDAQMLKCASDKLAAKRRFRQHYEAAEP
ncbi:hypothetical protein [Spongiibacter sp. UBA1325]|uniref:hypothetical protein n=1 Tax=Spongiibacter sp. UBA1325 TaxID=1947543 RepID=UPI00257D47DB|nr:hypothetical protein [Spongiibacter sp. UBA1325]|tara:strand:+ start:11592 stop:11981 length:390 start_codon:yes stop_codon:yes gene_type:complete